MSIFKTATTSKVARLTAVAGLVGASVVGLATIADAAATPALTLSSATGSETGGDLLIIKGKGFMDDAYANQVLGWDFSAAACTTTASNTKQGNGVLNVTSATTATLKTPTGAPSLAAGTWYLCFWDVASGSTGNILGQAKFVTGTAPDITKVNTITEGVGTDQSASSLGGTVVTIEGTSFTKKAAVTVDGVAATKTTYVSATKVTAVLPAHAAGADYGIKLTTEYGSDTTTGVLVDYVGVVSVSPAVGKAAGATIQLTGKGFNTYNTKGWATGTAGGAAKYVVALVPGGTTMTENTTDMSTLAAVKYCTNILVEGDTSLSCQTPALSGAYAVQILLFKADGKTLETTANGGITTVGGRVSVFMAADL